MDKLKWTNYMGKIIRGGPMLRQREKEKRCRKITRRRQINPIIRLLIQCNRKRNRTRRRERQKERKLKRPGGIRDYVQAAIKCIVKMRRVLFAHTGNVAIIPWKHYCGNARNRLARF